MTIKKCKTRARRHYSDPRFQAIRRYVERRRASFRSLMDELSAIRAKRLAELSGGAAPNGAGPSNADDAQRQIQQRQAQEEEEEATRQMMGQILEPDARDRLSRIALVRPERSRAISELLIRMARSGQLRGKVTEPQLLSVLAQVEANEKRATGPNGKEAGKITFSRRKGVKTSALDSDEDEDEDPVQTSAARRKAPPIDDDEFDIE